MRHYNSGLKTWVHNYMMRVRTDGATAVAIRPTARRLSLPAVAPNLEQ